MKNKEWLKEEINKVTSRIYGADFNTIKETDDLINQLEEPEQEKVAVPQFVADWIEKNRDKTTLLDSKAMMIQRCIHDDLRVLDWVDDNEDLFIRAWLDGYTVEKEKLYRVKVDQGPNYTYVESLHLYSDVIKPLDFNYKFSAKEHALKFASRNQAKGVAELVDGEVEEVPD